MREIINGLDIGSMGIGQDIVQRVPLAMTAWNDSQAAIFTSRISQVI